MSNLLDKISELEQQIVELRAEAEKEEKESKSTNKRWRGKDGDIRWFVNSNGKPDWLYNCNRDTDNFHYDTHNYFQTEDKAQKYANVLETERQLKRLADKHNGKIDWSDNDLVKYYLCYNYIKQSIFIDSAWARRYPRVIYFSSKEIAEQAIKTIGEDKIKEYLTYEW